MDLADVRAVVCDVDGVLTDGKLTYGADGEATKTFHVRDGHGIRALLEAGVAFALITARSGEPLRRRAADLGIPHVLTGRSDKGVALAELAATLGIPVDAMAYVGDDTIDVPALQVAGLGVAPADGHASARAAAGWVTQARGGHGVVRELADAVLAARAGADAPFHVVIPARMTSTRLPGKPLAMIGDAPMVVHVWRRAVEAGARSVVVAHDDDRIGDAIAAVGGQAMRTRADHVSGSDRIAEVVAARGWADDDIVVNLQGDEPSMPASALRRAATCLARTPAAGIATLATPIHVGAELRDPAVVKVVLDDRGLARTFSRAPMPWVREAFTAGVPDALPAGVRFLRHLGLYAYRVAQLRRICATPPHPWELAESLEQLRALAIGIAIAVDVLDTAPSPGVDTPEDLARVRRHHGHAGIG